MKDPPPSPPSMEGSIYFQEIKIMSEPKKMERPRTGRMLAGVCAAIADYVNMDATVVRVIYVLLTLLTSFCGAVVYFILMLVIPEAKGTFNINNDKK